MLTVEVADIVAYIAAYIIQLLLFAIAVVTLCVAAGFLNLIRKAGAVAEETRNMQKSFNKYRTKTDTQIQQIRVRLGRIDKEGKDDIPF